MNEKVKGKKGGIVVGALYKWKGVFWSYDGFVKDRGAVIRARCPKDRCELSTSSFRDNVIVCPKCDFKMKLDKPLHEAKDDARKIMEADYFKDAEIINIDGEMIKVGKEVIKDDDYWIEAKVSKSPKGVKQLMVLVGSKKDEDKAQLFLDIDNEKLSFDQNNKHPSEILAKVVAVFKKTKSEIQTKKDKK
jgi:hypothetical protein